MSILNEEERDRAKAIGADSVLRSRRYRTLRDTHIFPALDGAVQSMDGVRFTNPYDGEILGGLAGVLIRHDRKVLWYLRRRKVEAFVDESRGERAELFRLVGLLIAEQYLRARKDSIPPEPRLTPPEVLLSQLEGLFEEMREAGEAMTALEVTNGEVALTLDDLPDAANIAQGLIEAVVGSYEALLPATDDDDEIPNGVQREAMAKAAFLRLGVNDLAELTAEHGIENVPTKAAMAKVLAERYADELDEVARLTLRRTEGDPEFGLVTRLVQLREPPDIAATNAALQELRGHYIEPRAALFFVFGDAVLSPSERILNCEGTIRSFSVSPAEAGGDTRLNARPATQNISVRLQADNPWAEVNARRTTDLSYIRAVLRRTGEVVPTAEVTRPDPLADNPYNTWDTRTLWILEFLQRDLQATELKLIDTLMANFVSPNGNMGEDEVDIDAEEEAPRPNIDSVQLRGQQLHDHPEACARIVGRSHLRDIEMRIRRVVDRQRGTSRLVRVRLAWEKDHIAVMSGADGDEIDTDLHRQLVRLVTRALERPLQAGLMATLQRIERRAGESDIEQGAPSVLDVVGSPDDSGSGVVVAPVG